MPYEITATRKRPQTFGDLAGQEFVSTTLKASIASGRIAHAYLFSGPRGCGKTSTARILAKSLNCEKGPTSQPCGECDSCTSIARGSALDVIEIDGASNTSVDNIRQIKDEVLFPPNSSRYKIYIIDEVHMLSNSAFNALLKTIEEPPPYVIFIFATTELHKVPATIKSRCQQFTFRLFSMDVIRDLLRSVVDETGMIADDDALLWIAREATGSMRDAYTLFDQIAAFSAGHITEAKIREKLGLVGVERMASIFGACLDGQRSEVFASLDSILSSGVSIEQFVNDAISFVRSWLFLTVGVERESLLGMPRSAFPASLAGAIDPIRLEKILADLFELHRAMRYSVNPRWELELVMGRISSIRDYIPPAELAATVRQLKGALVDGSARIDLSRMPASSGKVPSVAPDSPGPKTTPAPFSEQIPERSQSGLTGTANDGTETPVANPEARSDDLDGLRGRLIQAVGKSRVVLSACLERSGQWSIADGEKLIIPCANSYDAGAVLAENGLLSRKISEMTGRSLRIEPRSAEPVRRAEAPARDEETEDQDDGDDGPADPVTIVERVFRGRRVGEPRAIDGARPLESGPSGPAFSAAPAWAQPREAGTDVSQVVSDDTAMYVDEEDSED